ncbi:MAG: tRNA (adenosine(37)-N6)-dimethylallyltransferase MiaA [Bacteroidetes bacterium]|nr:tRNA (adenosine(37)-N6)-dimethylallyltransferase MiaA [Bacteroidota bacterium]
MQSSDKYLIVVAGPTAIGKSDLSVALAKEFDCEIISADSRQFYKEMCIGTAKPSIEDMQGVPHHFIDNISIEESYNVGKFEEEAIALLHEIFKQKSIAIMVGGSGLYINAVLYGMDDLPKNDPEIRAELEKNYQEFGLSWLQEKLKEVDPEYFKSAEINNTNRIMRAIEVSLITGIPYSQQLNKKTTKRDFKTIFIVLNTDREKLYDRINRRVDQMMKNGLVEEVKNLLPHKSNNALNTVGYKELFEHLEGNCTLDTAIENIKQNSRRYAKRQITWFKKNKEAKWFEPTDKEAIEKFIKDSLH